MLSNCNISIIYVMLMTVNWKMSVSSTSLSRVHGENMRVKITHPFPLSCTSLPYAKQPISVYERVGGETGVSHGMDVWHCVCVKTSSLSSWKDIDSLSYTQKGEKRKEKRRVNSHSSPPPPLSFLSFLSSPPRSESWGEKASEGPGASQWVTVIVSMASLSFKHFHQL